MNNAREGVSDSKAGTSDSHEAARIKYVDARNQLDVARNSLTKSVDDMDKAVRAYVQQAQSFLPSEAAHASMGAPVLRLPALPANCELTPGLWRKRLSPREYASGDYLTLAATGNSWEQIGNSAAPYVSEVSYVILARRKYGELEIWANGNDVLTALHRTLNPENDFRLSFSGGTVWRVVLDSVPTPLLMSFGTPPCDEHGVVPDLIACHGEDLTRWRAAR